MIQAFLFSNALIQLLKKISYMTYMYRLTEKIFTMNPYVQKVYGSMNLYF